MTSDRISEIGLAVCFYPMDAVMRWRRTGILKFIALLCATPFLSISILLSAPFLVVMMFVQIWEAAHE